jgi:glycine hydroxymethyltransferase
MNSKVASLIDLESKRQKDTLQMIPSENHVSVDVREAMGSVFSNKYAEGYPGKRYYQGNAVVDQLERLCQEEAKRLFKVPHVNVQPLSGSPANLAILKALKQSDKDIQLSQALSMGGHLSMGYTASITSEYMKAIHYGLTPEGEIRWEELEKLALEHKPRVIWAGGTGYTKVFKWEKYAQIADRVGAIFVADVSHIGGLIAGGAHPSPVPFAHVVMTTTHKTLRGPRGAMILVTEKGLEKDPDLGKKIDSAVFPGIQGGPHMENIAALVVALQEASTPEFKKYSAQIVKNAKALAESLINRGYTLIGGGSENHMIIVDLTTKGIDGWTAAWALESAGMVVNKQTIPHDSRPYYPSGIRLGAPAITTRGMKEKEMEKIATWMDQAINYARVKVEDQFDKVGSSDKPEDQLARKQFKEFVTQDKYLAKIALEVKKLGSKFPTP